eukprot:scaffold4843_cov143-Skeletonema_menzelii.AAC.4
MPPCLLLDGRGELALRADFVARSGGEKIDVWCLADKIWREQTPKDFDFDEELAMVLMLN